MILKIKEHRKINGTRTALVVVRFMTIIVSLVTESRVDS